jgi:AcrR family transcriptional regulator
MTTGPGTTTGAATRHKLVDTATRAFAENGIDKASLLDIARQAGQRNRGAVHYHFGSRTGILVAVLEQHVDFLSNRCRELHEAATTGSPGSAGEPLAPYVEAIVLPSVELADTGWRGRCVLVIIAELAGADPSTLDPSVAEVLARTGGQPLYDELAARLGDLPQDLLAERLTLMTTFILRSVADRAVAAERSTGRPQLDSERFTANLVAMITGMLTAPVP